jgi:anti-sigma-K factor RskA
VDAKEFISSGILEQYVLGTATAEEIQQVEQMVFIYPEVQKEIDSIRQSLEGYAASFAVKPDDTLKEKIKQTYLKTNATVVSNLSQGNGEIKTETPVRQMRSYTKYAAAAAILLLLGSAILNYVLYNKYNTASKELAKNKTELDNREALNAQLREEIKIVSDKYSFAVSLNGTKNFPEAAAKVYYVKNTGDVYLDPSYLPQVPADKQYQLWAIVDGKPLDAGVITKDGKTVRIQKMKSFGNVKVNAFAVTLEKAGGSPTPTPDQMYVLGNL